MGKLLILLFLFSIGTFNILAIDASAEITREAEKILPKVIEWRRHLHQYPELGNRETKTAAYIEKHLRGLSLDVRTKIAKTGVIGILKGD